MGCNSYSYTVLELYRNDDMSAEITIQRSYNDATVYNVWAGSYDGSMDIYESFRTLDAARALYDNIMDNYTDTPPIKRELNKAIRAAHRMEAA